MSLETEQAPATYTIKLGCTNCSARDDYELPFGQRFFKRSELAGSHYQHPTETEDTMAGTMPRRVMLDCTNCGVASLVLISDDWNAK